ncbi:folate-binding protein [Marinobacter daepoensis]|uniref:CAF17-like 4Fe-4S cluster assembly/insertion protein YgfZ n=1 Tax=Marinobacter daepoensis TaxID=262077 RepID=UPI001C98D0D8|nr:folate-binding protein [Marinobacter daepoensis]MBY6034295.1 folate-binding protein [Marinobacter daepoensis]
MTNTETPRHANPHGWANLTDRVLARISGPGADKFVQGQFSQNVDEVTSAQSLRAAASTPKGRAYCLTRLVRDGEDLLIALEQEMAEETITHLNKYLMLFRGTSLERLESGRVIGLMGSETAEAIAGTAARDLTQPGQQAETPLGYLIRLEDDIHQQARYELWQITADGTGLPATEASLPDWQASEIRAGVPHLTPATRESYVPQMLNLQHLQGIHYKKGCYTGQEVIARMHFLGQLKKSLFRLAFSGIGTAPDAGTRLIVGDKAVGEVVNAVQTTPQGGEMLAVIRHDSASQPLTLEGAGNLKLTVLDLPYPVPERENPTGADT